MNKIFGLSGFPVSYPVCTVLRSNILESKKIRNSVLTEYCREEFEKFTTFLTSKKCQNWSVFRVKKVVLVFVTIVTLRQ